MNENRVTSALAASAGSGRVGGRMATTVSIGAGATAGCWASPSAAFRTTTAEEIIVRRFMAKGADRHRWRPAESATLPSRPTVHEAGGVREYENAGMDTGAAPSLPRDSWIPVFTHSSAVSAVEPASEHRALAEGREPR